MDKREQMTFTGGNPQEEPPRRVAKKSKKRFLWLALVTLLALIAVVLSVLYDRGEFDGLRRRLLGKALPQSFVLLPELRHGLLHSLLRLPGKAEFCRIRCADVRNTIFNIQFPVPEPSGPQRNVLFQHCIASLRLRARDPPSSRALCHDAFIICQPYFRLFRMASSSS